MYKIGVIGDKSSVQGFLAIGLDIFVCDSKEEATTALSKCVKNDYAIIYITEQLAALIPDEIEKYSEAQLPAIIPIPGFKGSLGIGMANVKKSIERAVGSDIISNE